MVQNRQKQIPSKLFSLRSSKFVKLSIIFNKDIFYISMIVGQINKGEYPCPIILTKESGILSFILKNGQTGLNRSVSLW